jgi:hypothetical protein
LSRTLGKVHAAERAFTPAGAEASPLAGSRLLPLDPPLTAKRGPSRKRHSTLPPCPHQQSHQHHPISFPSAPPQSPQLDHHQHGCQLFYRSTPRNALTDRRQLSAPSLRLPPIGRPPRSLRLPTWCPRSLCRWLRSPPTPPTRPCHPALTQNSSRQTPPHLPPCRTAALPVDH